MYARVIANSIRPGMEETAVERAHAGIAINEQRPGFAGQFYLLDPHTNQSLLISLWEDDPSPHTFDQAYTTRMQGAGDVLAEPVKPHIYEVKVFKSALLQP